MQALNAAMYDSAATERRAVPRPPLWSLLLLAVVGAAACDERDSYIIVVDPAPQITRMEVPTSITRGNAMLVVVEALGRPAVSSISVRVTGAWTAEFVTPFDAVTDTARVSHTVTLPDTVTGLQLRVEAFATSPTGADSPVVVRTVNIFGVSPLEAAADRLLEQIAPAPARGTGAVAATGGSPPPRPAIVRALPAPPRRRT